MGASFWIKRFVLAFFGAAVLLLLVELAKGYQLASALQFGALWGGVFASIFTLIGYVRYKRNPACMLLRQRGQ